MRGAAKRAQAWEDRIKTTLLVGDILNRTALPCCLDFAQLDMAILFN
jgi:hypothetical protein